MIFNPAIIALLSGSFLTLSVLLYASWYGVRILRRWDIRSGSEQQLEMERRTYLISSVMAYVLGFQLLSLFLFIYTADRLAPLFSGAMCAAGSLHASSRGYPTLVLKIVNFLAAGVWLIVNSTDNTAFDYPLIRKKYALLLPITVLVAAETFFQTAYFLDLKPDIITSCCGTLFSTGADQASTLASLPWQQAASAFYAFMLLTLGSGLVFYFRGRGIYLFSLCSTVLFVISCAALIAYISPYFYELPTHHCPFCILHPEYNFVGYFLYLAFLAGGVTGLGAGAISPFAGISSLKDSLPRIRKELALICMASWTVALAISALGIVCSGLVMS